MSFEKAPIDPSVRIPAAIKAAGARSDEIIRQLNGQTAETPSPDEQPAAQPDPEPAAPAAEPETHEASEQPPLTADTRQGNAEEDSWKHKYQSIKGRYDRQEQAIRDLSAQVGELQRELARSRAEQPKASMPAELRAERLITPEEENDYGKDFLNVVGKKAREELAPVIHEYEQKISELTARLEGVNGYVATDARTRMHGYLDDKLSAWRELNRDEGFLDWLALPDPFSGAIRHDLLKEAYGRNDGPRVLNFFKGFLAEEAAVAPAQRAEPDPVQVTAKIPLETLAAPGRAKSAAGDRAPTEKPVFSRAQIAKFYADSAAGKYVGKDAEKDRLERQIIEATREGRIR